MRSMTGFDKRPCSSSTSEAIDPVHSSTSRLHCAAGTGAIAISIRYRLDPITCAITLPGSILRSMTEPLRT